MSSSGRAIAPSFDGLADDLTVGFTIGALALVAVGLADDDDDDEVEGFVNVDEEEDSNDDDDDGGDVAAAAEVAVAAACFCLWRRMQ